MTNNGPLTKRKKKNQSVAKTHVHTRAKHKRYTVIGAPQAIGGSPCTQEEDEQHYDSLDKGRGGDR